MRAMGARERSDQDLYCLRKDDWHKSGHYLPRGFCSVAKTGILAICQSVSGQSESFLYIIIPRYAPWRPWASCLPYWPHGQSHEWQVLQRIGQGCTIIIEAVVNDELKRVWISQTRNIVFFGRTLTSREVIAAIFRSNIWIGLAHRQRGHSHNRVTIRKLM